MGGCSPSSLRPPTPERPPTARRRSIYAGAAPIPCMIVDCAVYEHGRRATVTWTWRTRWRLPQAGRLRLDRALRADRGGVRRDAARVRPAPLAVEDAIHAHQRPKLEVYDDMVFLVLKTARYVDPAGGHRARRDPDLPRRRLHHHRAPRRGQLAEAGAGGAGGGPRATCATAPARCCTRSSTGSWTTTCPPSRGSRRTSTRWRTSSSPGGRTNPAERIIAFNARCSSSARPPRRWWSRSSSLRKGDTRRSTRRSATTSAT